MTPVETALDLVVDENWPERGVVDPVKLDQDPLQCLQLKSLKDMELQILSTDRICLQIRYGTTDIIYR